MGNFLAAPLSGRFGRPAIGGRPGIDRQSPAVLRSAVVVPGGLDGDSEPDRLCCSVAEAAVVTQPTDRAILSDAMPLQFTDRNF